MADVKRYVTAGGTFACILAIGFFMQSGANAPAPGGDNVALSDIALTAGQPKPVANTPVLSELKNPEPAAAPAGDITAEPAKAAEMAPPAAPLPASASEGMTGREPSIKDKVLGWVDRDGKEPLPKLAQANTADATGTGKAPIELSLLDSKTPTDQNVAPRQEPKMAANCEIAMTATPMAAALVKLDLSAPCLPNERMTMHHNGLIFTDTTDASGKFQMAVPAMSQTAVFIASFANGEGAVASTTVPTLKNFYRAAVQAEFEAGTSLHALEFGATYNGAGHIWSASTGEIADAAVGKGGFMLLLGNPAVKDAVTAQVYTFPSAIAEQNGDVALSVEIEVTAANCGKPVQAETLQSISGEAPIVQKLDLTMPDCDAIGDFLVLKKLVNDLKVASASN